MSLPYPRSLVLTLLLGSLGLSGCGSSMNLPDAVVGQQVQGPPVVGSVFGGHAPVVGAHVYLLQPGTTGYGSAATSILATGAFSGVTSAGGYAITPDTTDPNVPVGAKFVTSDSSGQFSVSGAYGCTAGQPVYLYAYGGSPLTTPPTTYTFPTTTTVTTTAPTPVTVPITEIEVSNAPLDNGVGGTATYGIMVGSALPLTANQQVVIAGLTGNLAILNGIPLTASVATRGANTTFIITATANYSAYTYTITTGTGKNKVTNTFTFNSTIANANYFPTSGPVGNNGGGNDNGHADRNSEIGDTSSGTGKFGTAGTATATESVTTTTPVTTYTPTTNPIVQLATLGNCPTTGQANFGSGSADQINFVYMNEVSTIATAYTFQPFTLASNNSAWDIGSSGTTQGLLGIENAANTAAQLYAIQGSTLISSTQDGEGHLANFQTLLNGVPNEGNGVVPQATIDTLANILAACVDSTEGTNNSIGTPCVTLFDTATDNGLTVAAGATIPTDTATAAINIARYPAGNHSSGSGDVDATYVSDLFGIPSGTVPYAPNLNAIPNDWTIAINYPETAVSGYTSATNPLLGKAESIAVDDIGQVWITAQGTSEATASEVRWSPLGAQNSTHTAGYIYGYISIDGSNNAWAGNADTTSGIEEFGSNGVLTNTFGSGFNKAYTVVTNNSGDAFFFANTSGTGRNFEMFEYGPGGTPLTQLNTSPSVFTAGTNAAHGAVDATGDLWITTETPGLQIGRVTPAGAAVFPTISLPSTGNPKSENQPEFPAIDGAGNAWIALQETNSEIYVVSPTGGQTILTSASTGADLTSTFGAAIDGNGNAWFANRDGNYGALTGGAGTNTLIEINGTTQTAISPSTNYFPEAQYGTNASNTTLTPVLNGSLNLAIDPSGNIWITNYSGSSVAEIVGAAAPVVTPLSFAAGSGKFGQKP
jgi:hypothetical protein